MLDISRISNAEEGSIAVGRFASAGLPVRKGERPKTVSGPLHVQCGGHGDPKYLMELLNDVLDWAYVEPVPMPYLDKVPIRLQGIAASDDAAAFISDTEFAQVLLAAPTIILELPLVCAHWAIVKGWAEPHYLQSLGLIPAGTVIVYTPRDREELEVCRSLFRESYHFACQSLRGKNDAGIARFDLVTS